MADDTLRFDTVLDNHPEHAQQVANIIAYWNLSEQLLGAIFALVVGTDPWHASQVLGAVSSGAAKVDLVESAATYTLASSPRLAEFEGLLKTVRTVMRTRNAYVHGMYATDGRGRLILVRQGFDIADKTQRRPIELAQLKQDLQRCVELHHALIAFHNALTAEMPVAASPAWLYKAGQRRSGSGGASAP